MEFTLSSEAQGSRNVISAEQKAPPISFAFPGEKRHLYVPLNFYNVNSLSKAKGHYRDKTVVVKTLSKRRSHR